MIDEAIIRKDSSSLDMMLEQCLSCGPTASSSADRILRYQFIESTSSISAAMLVAKSIERCGEAKIKLSVELCQRVLSPLVSHCKWNHAYDICMYMISNELSFNSTTYDIRIHGSTSMSSILSPSSSSVDKAVFFTLGALLHDSDGVCKALRLVEAVARHRRHDLAMLCNYSQASAAGLSSLFDDCMMMMPPLSC